MVTVCVGVYVAGSAMQKRTVQNCLVGTRTDRDGIGG